MPYDIESIPQKNGTSPEQIESPTDRVRYIGNNLNSKLTSNSGVITNSSIIAESILPVEGKPNLDFSNGGVSWSVGNLTNGETIRVDIELPYDIPVDSQYFKILNDIWVSAPEFNTANNGDNIAVLRITDGGFGDADNVANGIIVDPFVIGLPLIFTSTVNENNGGSGCSGDCTYPTLGLDKHGRRLVDNGFSYNNYMRLGHNYSTKIKLNS